MTATTQAASDEAVRMYAEGMSPTIIKGYLLAAGYVKRLTVQDVQRWIWRAEPSCEAMLRLRAGGLSYAAIGLVLRELHGVCLSAEQIRVRCRVLGAVAGPAQNRSLRCGRFPYAPREQLSDGTSPLSSNDPEGGDR